MEYSYNCFNIFSNSNISALFFTNWLFSLWVVVPCLFYDFEWMPGTVNFIMLGHGCFGLSVNLIELSSVLHYSGKTYLYLMPYKSWGFVFWLVGSGTISGLMCTPGMVSPNSFRWLFPCLREFSHVNALLSTLLNTWGAPSTGLWSSVCAVLSSLVFFLMCSSCLGISRCSAMSP